MKLLKKTKIDINSYYKNGFSQTIVIKEYYLRLVEEINKLKWVKDEKGQYNNVPIWTKDIENCNANNRFKQEKESCITSLKNCPKELKEIIEEMIKDERVIGNFSSLYELKMDFIDVWDGVEDMGWHWDGPCQSEMVSLIYINDQNINLEYGGNLELGIRDIPDTKDWASEYENVETIGVFTPSGRTQIWINNKNPRFVHRAKPLSDKNTSRITITFGVSFIAK